MMKLALLGATGSIGSQTLDVIRLHPDDFELCAVTCGSDIKALRAIVDEFHPAIAGVLNANAYGEHGGTRWICGADVNERAILESGCDTVLDAVVGMAGLNPVMTALDAGKRVLLANKEALIAGGELVMNAARALDKKLYGALPEGHMPPRSLTPVDSEHSALFQSMAGHPAQVKNLILTASGGPFRKWEKPAIYDATPAQALNHPTWNMGGKVTIDSASLFNKGLEVIEACRLFDMPPERIKVLVHPQSIVHSMVEFTDNAVIAQLGTPDMRGPIGHALGYPERIDCGVSPLELAGRELTFDKPDMDKFPCLKLAYEALAAGGGMPCVMNAADEAAVAAFLKNSIPFGRIPEIISATMHNFRGAPAESASQLIELGSAAREYAGERT